MSDDPISLVLLIKDMSVNTQAESVDAMDTNGQRAKMIVKTSFILTISGELEDPKELQDFYTRFKTAATPRVIVTI